MLLGGGKVRGISGPPQKNNSGGSKECQWRERYSGDGKMHSWDIWSLAGQDTKDRGSGTDVRAELGPRGSG